MTSQDVVYVLILGPREYATYRPNKLMGCFVCEMSFFFITIHISLSTVNCVQPETIIIDFGLVLPSPVAVDRMTSLWMTCWGWYQPTSSQLTCTLIKSQIEQQHSLSIWLRVKTLAATRRSTICQFARHITYIYS